MGPKYRSQNEMIRALHALDTETLDLLLELWSSLGTNYMTGILVSARALRVDD